MCVNECTRLIRRIMELLEGAEREKLEVILLFVERYIKGRG